MEKLIYLCTSPASRDGDATRDLVLGALGPELLGLGPTKLWVEVDDSDADVPVPMPPPAGERQPDAFVSIWLDRYDDRAPYEARLREAFEGIAGYLVTESLYTDYGGNRWAAPRDWPDGARSPGIVMVTLLEQPARMAYDDWVTHWHTVQSPVSESMQPRARYVRNAVVRAVTPDAPPWKGIVEEAWPSAEHVTDPKRFYCAETDEEMQRNLSAMLDSVTGFLDLDRIRSIMTSEYFLRT